jgi:membrane protease YdiL (CAAX protease family)
LNNVFTRAYGFLLLLALIAIFLAAPRPLSPIPLIAGALISALLLALGLRAAAPFGRGAPILETLGSAGKLPPPSPLRRLGVALLAGVVMGGILLAALMLLASVEPLLKARLAARADQPSWMPWVLATEASILEEIVFRLFLLSGVVWLATRLFGKKREMKKKQQEAPQDAPPTVVWVAIGISALAFGLIHLPSWMAVVNPTPFLVAAVLALNGVAGVALGQVYWRWGIEAAILCHFAGDMMLQGLGPHLMGG